MKLKSFMHGSENSLTTLSEIRRVHDWAETKEFFGLFAYATQSGAAAFELAMGEGFSGETVSRWMFGIDYGRTQPAAIRRILEFANADVRIVDGAWLVEKPGFLPRRDYHAKAAFCSNEDQQRFGLVVGSGNFSANGLKKSIEAGATLQAGNINEFRKTIKKSFQHANEMWKLATPAMEIIDLYEKNWEILSRGNLGEEVKGQHGSGETPSHFWIEAGYITKNRGPEHPGNQIDFPRGMCRYFGFDPPDDLPKNSVIGSVTFNPPDGGHVVRNLRLGNNLMEKISLPIPETHGFDIYDGKVLVFDRKDGICQMWALEADDFNTVFSDRIASVRTMNSGRRYGHFESLD